MNSKNVKEFKKNYSELINLRDLMISLKEANNIDKNQRILNDYEIDREENLNLFDERCLIKKAVENIKFDSTNDLYFFIGAYRNYEYVELNSREIDYYLYKNIESQEMIKIPQEENYGFKKYNTVIYGESNNPYMEYENIFTEYYLNIFNDSEEYAKSELTKKYL